LTAPQENCCFPSGKDAVRSNLARNRKRKDAGALESSCAGFSTASERLVDWDGDTMNTPDNEFHELIQQFSGRSIVLADDGFRKKGGVPENGKRCPKGCWNDRMSIETSFSLLTVICGLKRMFHRLEPVFRLVWPRWLRCSMCC